MEKNPAKRTVPSEEPHSILSAFHSTMAKKINRFVYRSGHSRGSRFPPRGRTEREDRRQSEIDEIYCGLFADGGGRLTRLNAILSAEWCKTRANEDGEGGYKS